MTQLVFVYGTLRPGEHAARLLGDSPRYEAAVVDGELGRAVDTGLYGAVFDRGQPWPARRGVPGFVVDVTETVLDRLDRYEGEGYDRVRVHTRTGEECWAYEWNGDWGELEVPS